MIFVDASIVLEIGSITMRETQLHFTRPDDTLWTKSTFRVKNIPPDISQERVELTFESKKIWGREEMKMKMNILRYFAVSPNRSRWQY